MGKWILFFGLVVFGHGLSGQNLTFCNGCTPAQVQASLRTTNQAGQTYYQNNYYVVTKTSINAIGGGAGSAVPSGRTISIVGGVGVDVSGGTQDLSVNRTWTVSILGSGSLTTNYAIKWNGTNFVNSLIYAGSSFVGINTTSADGMLVVNQSANTVPSTNSNYGFALLNQGTFNIGIGSGSTYNFIQSLSSKMLQINPQANDISLAMGSGKVIIAGTNNAAPTYNLSFGGNAARTIGMERNQAGVGLVLTVQGSGATASNTNLNGGDLVLKTGTSTGTGTANFRVFTTGAGSSGTADNNATEKFTILGNGNVGVGLTTPIHKLQVNGNIVANEGMKVGFRYTSGDQETYHYWTANGATPMSFYNVYTSSTTSKMFTFNTSGGGEVITVLGGGSIGISNANPSTSAVLDLGGTDRGFLPPRMTLAQRNAITSPAEGLMIYQTDGTKGWYGYNGSSWEKLNN